MTNNDDVIVYGEKQLNKCVNSWGKLERNPKPINLSELAREKLKSIENDLRYNAKEKKGCKQIVIEFLSKIREAMK